MIRIADVVHTYQRYGKSEEDTITIQALDHVDMEVKAGQFIAIIGHNGSGKSTLAKHLNALLLPSEGTVWIDDMATNVTENVGEIRKRVCMVFQNPDNQIIGATVEEDIAFGLENMKIPTERMQEKIDASLEAIHMTEKRSANPGNLSGGQKQKTAIAGAIAVEPKCLVLDEATAMLDPQARKEVIEIAEELNRTKGITIILITHHMDEVIHADKIFVMNQGKVAASGTPQEIFLQTDMLEKYHLEVPAVTRMAVEMVRQGIDLKLPVLTVEQLTNQICRYGGNSSAN